MRPLEGVRELRERRMLSQQELAERAGVSLFTIQRIERGEGAVRPTTGRAVAAALGVRVEELLPKAQAPLFPSAEEGPELRRTHYLTLWTGYILMRAQKIEETIDSGNMTPEWGVALYKEANSLSSLTSKLVPPLGAGTSEEELRTLAGLFRALRVLDEAVDRLDDALITFVSEKEREEQRAAFKNTLSLIHGGLKSA